MKEIWYIKLHRQIKENILFQEKRTFSKFEAWIDILMSCNFVKWEFLLWYEVYEIEVWSFITSKVKLQKKYGWSKVKLNNFLELLEKQNMIHQKTVWKWNHKATQLFVNNYSKYQYDIPKEWPSNEPKEDPKKTLSEPQYKKDNKYKKDNNIYKWDKSHWDINEELEKFINYWNNTFWEKRKVTHDLLDSYKTLRKKYTKEELWSWANKYFTDKKDTEKQYLLSPIKFFTQKNGLASYL